jgi:uncharacterized protein YbjT (DUF2867 family)
MDTHLIIGGTGKVGRRVADDLRHAGRPVRVATRRGGDARFDWYDPATYAPALGGVEAVYLTGPGSSTDYSPLVSDFLAEAGRAGVRRVVLLSARAAIFQPEGVVARAEQAVRDSPVSWTILRPAWFAQNFTEGIFIPRDDTVTAPVGNGLEPFIDVADIAAVAAATLTGDQHAGETIDLSGPEAMTFAEAVAVVGEQAGRNLRFVAADPDDFAREMSEAGMTDVYVAWRMAMFEGIRDGRDAFLSDGVDRVLGRPATTFAAWAAHAAPSLQESAGRP